MPTHRAVLKQLITLLSPQFKGKIIDLGSGFGFLAWRVARTCPQTTVIGYEISFVPWLIATLLFRRKNLRFERVDFFKKSLHEADMILCYLYPGAMEKLEPKFATELSRTLVISHTFALPQRKAHWQQQAKDLYRTPIYGYFYQKFAGVEEEA